MLPTPLTRDQVRQIDKLAIERLGITGAVLMENAGRGVVDTLERLGVSELVIILCGRGNNGGDGFVIARHLALRGHACRVLLLASPDHLTGDALTNYRALEQTPVPIFPMSSLTDAHEFENALDNEGASAEWVVDALLGTGAEGAPRPPYDTAIRWMNLQSAKRLAVDIPSGLDCDTGEAAEPTFVADHTCTFVAPKIGFSTAAAKTCLGEVHILDIGVSADWLA